jgi:hypothetical protein
MNQRHRPVSPVVERLHWFGDEEKKKKATASRNEHQLSRTGGNNNIALLLVAVQRLKNENISNTSGILVLVATGTSSMFGIMSAYCCYDGSF